MDAFKQQLEQLSAKNQYRSIPDLVHQGRYITRENRKMLNMSSNDYLGLASNENLRQSFLQQYGDNFPSFTSSSSRLLTGNFPIYTDLEQLIAQRFQRESALLFNSGYHANLGILPALTTTKSLILADKLVHASMIDGIRLSQCEFFRYRHNDYEHLKSLLEKNAGKFDRTFIVTESVFSMDGDVADLNYLAQLKTQFPNTYLYVDEAHAYKNLYLFSKMRNVSGISATDSQKSSDMLMKCRYMDEITGGKGIVFATGTPVSNSMAELYTMQRYLQYDELKKLDVKRAEKFKA